MDLTDVLNADIRNLFIDFDNTLFIWNHFSRAYKKRFEAFETELEADELLYDHNGELSQSVLNLISIAKSSGVNVYLLTRLDCGQLEFSRKIDYILRNVGDIFNDFYYVDVQVSKGDFIYQLTNGVGLNTCCLVDDDIENIVSCDRYGILTLNYVSNF